MRCVTSALVYSILCWRAVLRRGDTQRRVRYFADWIETEYNVRDAGAIVSMLFGKVHNMKAPLFGLDGLLSSALRILQILCRRTSPRGA